MTVGELIEELNKFPKTLPVTVINNIYPSEIKDPYALKVRLRVWTHSNYPYDKPDFLYVNID